jgi:acyl-CoA synthetase (NDP forming)
MVKEIKGYPVLEGIRGEPPSDVDAIVDIIMKVSSLVSANEAIDELDLNPVFVFKDGASVVDARMILAKG